VHPDVRNAIAIAGAVTISLQQMEQAEWYYWEGYQELLIRLSADAACSRCAVILSQGNCIPRLLALGLASPGAQMDVRGRTARILCNLSIGSPAARLTVATHGGVETFRFQAVEQRNDVLPAIRK
jgi:hypothetical protein